MDQRLHEGHLLPGVLHDHQRICGAAAQEVRSEDHGEVGGVHLGDVDHLRPDEELEEPDEEGDDCEMKVGKLLDEDGSKLGIISYADCLVVQIVIWGEEEIIIR